MREKSAASYKISDTPISVHSSLERSIRLEFSKLRVAKPTWLLLNG